MSYSNYEEAMKLAPNCRYYTIAGPRTNEEIEKSEKIFGYSFSKQCRDFYSKYGYLSFYGNEIFGINPDDDSGILEGNSIAYLVVDRAKYNLPKAWLPFYNFNDGNMAYLDYSNLNEDGEPRVIMAFYNGKKYVNAGVIAEDFGDFVLQLIKEQ